MIPLLRTVASALAAVLLGWLLPASAGAAVDVPLVAYTYDAAHIQAAPAHDRVERAPPTTQAVLHLHLASDRGWSVAFAWPETIYNTRNSSYDQSVPLVPTDSSAAGGEATLSGAPEMVPGMGWERAYSIRATGVAAETATVAEEAGSGVWSALRARMPSGDAGSIRIGRNSDDQAALIQLAKEARRTGVSNTDARTLLDWADEVGLPGRGPEIHPNRPTVNFPHIHIGPVGHIPVL